MLLAPPLLWNSGVATRKTAVATAAAASPPAEGGGKADGGAVAGGVSRTMQLGAMMSMHTPLSSAMAKKSTTASSKNPCLAWLVTMAVQETSAHAEASSPCAR
jgi:hypothetical protein